MVEAAEPSWVHPPQLAAADAAEADAGAEAKTGHAAAAGAAEAEAGAEAKTGHAAAIAGIDAAAPPPPGSQQ